MPAFSRNRAGLLAAASVALLLTPAAPAETTVLIGGTVIDVTDSGRSTDDLDNAYVLIEGDRITAVGSADGYEPPPGASIIDTHGQFIVPGLIDGFATLNDQTYANAFLYEGVTSYIGVDGGRRGELDRTVSPGPHLYELESVGYEAATTEQLLRDLEALHDEGISVALLMYRIEPEQLPALVKRARELNMGTIGELAAATYAQGNAAGIDAFVHTTRYSLDLASDDMRRGVLGEPFSDDLASPKWTYYLWLAQRTRDEPIVQDLARAYAEGGAALMPTLALLYLDQPFASNPWHEPIATILAPGQLDSPASRISGRHVHDQKHLDAYAKVAAAELQLDAAYFAAGTRYLAGSATDVWGTMPGISLHQELELLARIGLSPRQALAAATSNIAETFRFDRVGSVTAGYRADLLVLDSDPRDDVRHLRDVSLLVRDGAIIDRATLLQPPRYTEEPDGTILDRAPFHPGPDFINDDGTPHPEYPWLADVQMESITYASDGLRVKGFLVRPKAAGPHPCVIYNRGGNREFASVSPWKVSAVLAQMASWGYVVTASQYRGVAGSDGMEQFGGDDVNDVLNLIPLLESVPDADAERLGMLGGSRGGMMTCLALARTDRIDAAVLRCGVTDLTQWGNERPGMIEVFNDLVPEFDPDDPMSLASRSAIHWAENLDDTAPLMLVQGTADWRVEPASALRFANRLLELQHPFRLVMLEGSDHGLTEHRVEFMRLTREWFDRFVRDGAPLPNMKPHGS